MALAACASSGATYLFLFVTNKKLHVDGRFVIHATSHSDGCRSAAQHHAGKADVLGHHDVVWQKTLYDGEICAVRSDRDIEHIDPKAIVAGVSTARFFA